VPCEDYYRKCLNATAARNLCAAAGCPLKPPGLPYIFKTLANRIVVLRSIRVSERESVLELRFKGFEPGAELSGGSGSITITRETGRSGLVPGYSSSVFSDSSCTGACRFGLGVIATESPEECAAHCSGNQLCTGFVFLAKECSLSTIRYNHTADMAAKKHGV